MRYRILPILLSKHAGEVRGPRCVVRASRTPSALGSRVSRRRHARYSSLDRRARVVAGVALVLPGLTDLRPTGPTWPRVQFNTKSCLLFFGRCGRGATRDGLDSRLCIVSRQEKTPLHLVRGVRAVFSLEALQLQCH